MVIERWTCWMLGWKWAGYMYWATSFSFFILLFCLLPVLLSTPPPQVFAVSFVLSCYVNHLFNYAHRSPNNFFLIWLLDLKTPVCHYTLEMVTTLELVIPCQCQCQCLISNFSYFCNIFVLWLIFCWRVHAGVAFLKNAPEGTYDAVIVDSSDPIGDLIIMCEFLCLSLIYIIKIILPNHLSRTGSRAFREAFLPVSCQSFASWWCCMYPGREHMVAYAYYWRYCS